MYVPAWKPGWCLILDMVFTCISLIIGVFTITVALKMKRKLKEKEEEAEQLLEDENKVLEVMYF